MNLKLITLANKLYSNLTQDDIDEIYKNIQLSTAYKENQISIKGNSGGIFYLIIFLLESLSKNYPDHFHFDEYNGLEKGSIELIIEKSGDELL